MQTNVLAAVLELARIVEYPQVRRAEPVNELRVVSFGPELAESNADLHEPADAPMVVDVVGDATLPLPSDSAGLPPMGSSPHPDALRGVQALTDTSDSCSQPIAPMRGKVNSTTLDVPASHTETPQQLYRLRKPISGPGEGAGGEIVTEGAAKSARTLDVLSDQPPPASAAKATVSLAEDGLTRRSSRLSGIGSGASPVLPAGLVIMGTSLLQPDKDALVEVIRLLNASGVHAAYMELLDPTRPPTHVITQMIPAAASRVRDAAGMERTLRVCKRTLKIMQGVLCGAWVLGADWLDACVKAGAVLPEGPFEIDADVRTLPEPSDWFGPAKARRLAAERKVGWEMQKKEWRNTSSY